MLKINTPISPEELAAWCKRWLGSEPDHVLFEAIALSRVFGLALKDGRRVVVKVRPSLNRIKGCVEVQRHLWDAGFPCPQPLVGPAPLANYMATAEAFVEGGTQLEPGPDSPMLFASALARLI